MEDIFPMSAKDLEAVARHRPAMPVVSDSALAALAQYTTYLQNEVDVRPATLRNYLSDLRQFVAWCETTWNAGQEAEVSFAPMAITTPLVTRYRAYLQRTLRLQPASVNRALISIKRYCAWAVDVGIVTRNPASIVKPVGQQPAAPRHLSDREEEALLAAVNEAGTLRDRTLIIVLLHTGLRASEVCSLGRADVTLGKRSGTLHVTGKNNKYREIPLNSTARTALQEYLPTFPEEVSTLFPSGKTGQALSARALGHLIKRFARQAHLSDVSPHDLRHRFGYRMAEVVPLHRLAQIMGHDSLDTTMTYVRATRVDLQKEVEKIAWA
jgi:integrase/recombinase XerC